MPQVTTYYKADVVDAIGDAIGDSLRTVETQLGATTAAEAVIAFEVDMSVDLVGGGDERGKDMVVDIRRPLYRSCCVTSNITKAAGFQVGGLNRSLVLH